MEVVRIACTEPPASDRSRWSRELLLEAIAAQLPPAVLPVDRLTSFTATLPPHLAAALKKLASAHHWSVPQIAAGLIEAARQARATPVVAPDLQADTAEEDTELLTMIRAELHPLVKGCASAIAEEKIAFAEAATGTGKGRMIALLAARAARAGKRVVITAPLPITWQLADTLCSFEGVREAGVTLLLGRANFVSPDLLRDWATERERPDLLAWIDAGGPPRNPLTIKLQQHFGIRLNWLLDEALEIDDELEPGQVMLDADDDQEDCAAEEVYQSLQAAGSAAGIVLCSHHFIASHIRHSGLRKPAANGESEGRNSPDGASVQSGPLPERIDLLLVDEAHLLEQAFASIFSQSLYLKPFEWLIEKSVLRGRKAVLDAVDSLIQAVKSTLQERDKEYRSVTGTLEEFERVANRAQQLLDVLDTLKLARKDQRLRQSISLAKHTLKTFLGGHGTIRLEVSPVRHYPQILVGRANLERPLNQLWNRTRAAALVSATLYTDGVNAGLTRWKLGVPTERAAFLPAIIPAWVTDPVTLNLPPEAAPVPDDSPEWAAFEAEKILAISEAAAGGTLVLCTSYQNAHEIAANLLPHLKDRLIAQGAVMGASTCAARFREAYAAGLRPVWVGVGSAWTGIDLSDDSVEPQDDRMLTDLVITRLPMGVNRTLTSERRAAIAGFSVVLQEAVWHMRQGIGRLVRRKGVGPRNLWVLDPRLASKDNWSAPFRQALIRYRKVASPR